MLRIRRNKILLALALGLLVGCSEQPTSPQPEPIPKIPIQAAVQTAPLGDDADDPAIWVHPEDPALSLILGTNKAPAPDGALGVFGLDGQSLQLIGDLDRPNNVDIEYGFQTPDGPVDIAVVTERYQGRLRVFAIDPATRELRDISSAEGLAVFATDEGEAAAPMGVALYRRASDEAIFATLSRKTGPAEGYLAQYRLQADETGMATASEVRRFGRFSGTGEIEAVAIDDSLGYVYYSDEGAGVRKYHADPDHPDAEKELALFASQGFRGDREGIAIYAQPDGEGYVLVTDQIEGGSRYQVYRRNGGPGGEHDHSRPLAILAGPADETDGLEAIAVPLGDRFPQGLLAAMNSAGRNFMLFDFAPIAGEIDRLP